MPGILFDDFQQWGFGPPSNLKGAKGMIYFDLSEGLLWGKQTEVLWIVIARFQGMQIPTGVPNIRGN